MDAYELNKDKSKYNDMKENVNKMINVLSSNNVSDNIQRAINSINRDYVVNDDPVKEKILSRQKDKVYNCIVKLKEIKLVIDNKIDNINDDIKEAESNSGA